MRQKYKRDDGNDNEIRMKIAFVKKTNANIELSEPSPS